jgi:gas vesicle protein
MNSNQKFLSGIFLGAAAGAAIAFFLASDKGKEVIADAKDVAGKLGGDLKEKLQHLDKEIKGLLEKGKSLAENLENITIEEIL